MWFEDLSRCTHFPVDVSLVAVGWLERGRTYSRGVVDRAVFDALAEMRKGPWQPLVCAGFHECDLCRFTGEARGCANLFIPANGIIYVAPELIVHYINCHEYAPPDEFCRAVVACPPMRSIEYLKAMSACGSGRLLRSVKLETGERS